MIRVCSFFGVLEGIRTPDPLVRSAITGSLSLFFLFYFLPNKIRTNAYIKGNNVFLPLVFIYARHFLKRMKFCILLERC